MPTAGFTSHLRRPVEELPRGKPSSATIAIAFWVAAGSNPITEPPPAVSAQAAWSLIYLGLIPSGLATIVRFHLVRTVGVSMFAHVGNLIPVFGVIFGAVLLGETITPVIVGALALILAGVALARAGSAQG